MRQQSPVEHPLVTLRCELITVRRTALSNTEVFQLGRCGEISGEERDAVAAGDLDASAGCRDNEGRIVRDERERSMRRLIELARDLRRMFGASVGGVIARAGAVKIINGDFHSVVGDRLSVLGKNANAT